MRRELAPALPVVVMTGSATITGGWPLKT